MGSAARRKLRYALRWCRLNPVLPGGFAAGLGEGMASRDGGDCAQHIAGPGTPLVAAGSPTELGAALTGTVSPRRWAQTPGNGS